MAELKSHAAKFFEVVLKMDEMQDDNSQKMVKRTITVDAMSFAEAESKALEEMSAYASTEVEVVNINPAQYAEVFTSDDDTDDKFYKAKLQFITIDEETEKEKRSNVIYLVQAKTIARSLRYIDDIMGKTMIDYDSVGVSETNIFDCFFHSDKQEKEKDE